jgi:hypothetical protein
MARDLEDVDAQIDSARADVTKLATLYQVMHATAPGPRFCRHLHRVGWFVRSFVRSFVRLFVLYTVL